MLRLPGYTLLRNGSWKTPNGGHITEAQYANHVARYQGYKSYADFNKATNESKYQYFAELHERRTFGLDKPFDVDSEFAANYANARNFGWEPTVHGAYSDFLIYLGLRDDEDDWPPGESPPV